MVEFQKIGLEDPGTDSIVIWTVLSSVPSACANLKAGGVSSDGTSAGTKLQSRIADKVDRGVRAMVGRGENVSQSPVGDSVSVAPSASAGLLF